MATQNTEKSDFEEEFDQAVTDWCEKHRLREDDAVLLMVELFRIHQQHWDELRHRDLPSFGEFRADIAKLADIARTFQGQTATVLEAIRNYPAISNGPSITRAAAFFATVAGLLAGYLIGRVWP